ncbi:MAG: hypothetical protein QXX56_02800 [Candidatus Bathyarchaeia archaeon]
MEDDVNIKDILRRIDDLLNILKIISGDLEEISRILKAYVKSNIEEDHFALISGASQPLRKRSIEDVQRFFPKDLLGLLLFEETEHYIIIKPRQYLGSENFIRVASIVREQLSGEYVSQGKESHFKVPR